MIQVCLPNEACDVMVATLLLAFVLSGAGSATPASDVSLNRACGGAPGNELSCTLTTGFRTYRLYSSLTQYLKLSNTTGRPLQIDSIQGVAAGRGQSFLEYCISRNRFETGQSAAGEGEVACTSRNSGVAISGIHLRSSEVEAGLTVDPGDDIYVSFSPMATEPWFSVSVIASPATRRREAWRQPKFDQVIHCNGETQQTRWSPWVNQTGRAFMLRGAIIYSEAAEQPMDRVDEACLYILDLRGAVRYRACDGVSQRSPSGLRIRPQMVMPGEAVAGQASNACPAPAVWGWAAYLFVGD